MKIRILASESLGVRSMACVVQLKSEKIFIDPGVSLGQKRFKLSPHRSELDAAENVRLLLHSELSDTTHVVITHFHGDHHPMAEAETCQLDAFSVKAHLEKAHLFSIDESFISYNQKQRKRNLEQILKKSFETSPGKRFPFLSLSEPVPHGETKNKAGSVVMVKITEEDMTFVHASDSQLLNQESVDILYNWKPEVLFIAGPPLYILGNRIMALVSERLKTLSSVCETIILDHHIMRSLEGEAWLDNMSAVHGNILCAADFTHSKRSLLEANRKSFYSESRNPEYL